MFGLICRNLAQRWKRARRARLQISNRVVMLEDHERDLAKLRAEDVLFCSQIVEKEGLVCVVCNNQELSGSLRDEKIQS